MASKQAVSIYKITFLNQGEIYEIYARHIYQSELFGFIEAEEFVFGEKTQVVVDPSEEKLKTEFQGVIRSFIPVAAIMRIDEVEKEGVPKVLAAGEKVSAFPVTIGPLGPGKK